MTCLLRHVRVSSFLLAAVLIGACGGNTGDSSGSGGDGPVGGAGTGGTTSSTSSGGGGAGGTGGGSGCSPECVSPEVCEEGTCKTLTELQSIADDGVLLEGGVATYHQGQAQVCARVHKQVPPTEIIAEEGGCAAWGKIGPEEWSFVPIEAGDLTVESPNVGLLPLTVPSAVNCLANYLPGGMNLPPEQGFAPGETVTFAATGGAMFPAVQLETAFPDDLVLQGDPVFVSGQPYQIQWTGATPTKVYLLASVGDGTIECTPGPSGSLTVPASVTQHLTDLNQTGVLAVLEKTTSLEVSPSRRVTAVARRMVEYLAD